MRALLLYNPKPERTAAVASPSSTVFFNNFRRTASARPLRPPPPVGQQARKAIAAGVEAIFACGGDGTIHDILQAIANTTAVLGILPMGSANALARELRIPRDPVQRFSPNPETIRICCQGRCSMEVFALTASGNPVYLIGKLSHDHTRIDTGRSWPETPWVRLL